MKAGPAIIRVVRVLVRIALGLTLLAAGIALWLVLDARRTPTAEPEYVAMGSSYAAGAGLGPRQTGSPVLCSRSNNGYPPRLARALNLTLVDMTCSGSVTRHVLEGGQFFQDAQIRTLGPNTRLVTLTVGGNDVGFVRDLYLSAARKSDSVTETLIQKLWSGPPGIDQRNYAKLEAELTALLQTIRSRSPKATVVVATYPTVLPAHGTCPKLRLSNAEAALMRQVESKLAAVIREAARKGGATVVDMNALGAKHHACSSSPWTKGWGAISESPFHPTLEGAQATADAIAAAITPS
jgi:lysophospholipase L1-like esterase